jgi:hypothetical protein
MIMFLWMMPMPPSWARAMARSLSVTVSIGEETMGRLRSMFAGQLRADVHVARHHVAVTGLEENVVEGDALIGNPILHGGLLERKALLGHYSLCPQIVGIPTSGERGCVSAPSICTRGAYATPLAGAILPLTQYSTSIR